MACYFGYDFTLFCGFLPFGQIDAIFEQLKDFFSEWMKLYLTGAKHHRGWFFECYSTENGLNFAFCWIFRRKFVRNVIFVEKSFFT